MNPMNSAKSASCCEDQQEITWNFGLTRILGTSSGIFRPVSSSPCDGPSSRSCMARDRSPAPFPGVSRSGPQRFEAWKPSGTATLAMVMSGSPLETLKRDGRRRDVLPRDTPSGLAGQEAEAVRSGTRSPPGPGPSRGTKELAGPLTAWNGRPNGENSAKRLQGQA